MLTEPTSRATSQDPVTRETLVRMEAELVGRAVPDGEEAAVVEMLNFLAGDLAALKALDVGEIEPALVYRFER